MEAEDDKPISIYEIRHEKMVSPEDGKCKTRVARFLKPCAKHYAEAVGVPNNPLLFEIFSNRNKTWPPGIAFNGWRCPQKRWKEWVDRLAEKHAACWKETNMCDAIVSSMYEVHWNQDLFLGISQFWCPDTCTFVFPWGEATITLEDVMILGGYSVTGELISSTNILTDEQENILEEIKRQRKRLAKSKWKKSGFSPWLKYFMEEEQELEHVGFLSLWLSRYVFPCIARDTINPAVFPMAIKLSQGTKLALAPAVLADVYRSLSLLREQVMNNSSTPIIVSGPLQLVQLWVFEHFPALAPNHPNILKPGEPRVARWDKLNVKLNILQVESALKQANKFEWRPYAAELENWSPLSYYKETEQLMSNSSSLDEEMGSFFQCLLASNLVGLHSIEKYRPQRVAMQLGMDQDLPADACAFNLAIDSLIFLVPPRSSAAGVSARYSSWWKDLMSAREPAIRNILLQLENASNFKPSLEGDKKNSGCSVASWKPNNPLSSSRALKISSKDSSHSSTPDKFSTNTKTSVLVDNLTDDDIPLSNLFPKNVESETHPSRKRFKGNSDDSTESVTLKNPKKSSQQCTKESRESNNVERSQVRLTDQKKVSILSGSGMPNSVKGTSDRNPIIICDSPAVKIEQGREGGESRKGIAPGRDADYKSRRYSELRGKSPKYPIFVVD